MSLAYARFTRLTMAVTLTGGRPAQPCGERTSSARPPSIRASPVGLPAAARALVCRGDVALSGRDDQMQGPTVDSFVARPSKHYVRRQA